MDQFLKATLLSCQDLRMSGRLSEAPLTGKTGILFPLLISVHLLFYCSFT